MNRGEKRGGKEGGKKSGSFSADINLQSLCQWREGEEGGGGKNILLEFTSPFPQSFGKRGGGKGVTGH